MLVITPSDASVLIFIGRARSKYIRIEIASNLALISSKDRLHSEVYTNRFIRLYRFRIGFIIRENPEINYR